MNLLQLMKEQTLAICSAMNETQTSERSPNIFQSTFSIIVTYNYHIGMYIKVLKRDFVNTLMNL